MCLIILTLFNYTCSELVAKLSTQFTLYKPYTFFYIFYIFFLYIGFFFLESNQYFFFYHLDTSFHLLIDYLSIYIKTRHSHVPKKDIRRNFIKVIYISLTIFKCYFYFLINCIHIYTHTHIYIYIYIQ